MRQRYGSTLKSPTGFCFKKSVGTLLGQEFEWCMFHWDNDPGSNVILLPLSQHHNLLQFQSLPAAARLLDQHCQGSNFMLVCSMIYFANNLPCEAGLLLLLRWTVSNNPLLTAAGIIGISKYETRGRNVRNAWQFWWWDWRPVFRYFDKIPVTKPGVTTLQVSPLSLLTPHSSQPSSCLVFYLS